MLLDSVATQTALGLEVAELATSLAEEAAQRARLNREIEIAREVQERLLPQRAPAILGINLAGACLLALGVGGDYYDMIDLGDGRLAVAIGDVAGKGISAALQMASLRAYLRTLIQDGINKVSVLVELINKLFYEATTENRYATLFIGIYDSASGKLQYVNAGHNPPFVIRNGTHPVKGSVLRTAGRWLAFSRQRIMRSNRWI